MIHQTSDFSFYLPAQCLTQDATVAAGFSVGPANSAGRLLNIMNVDKVSLRVQSCSCFVALHSTASCVQEPSGVLSLPTTSHTENQRFNKKKKSGFFGITASSVNLRPARWCHIPSAQHQILYFYQLISFILKLPLLLEVLLTVECPHMKSHIYETHTRWAGLMSNMTCGTCHWQNRAI